MSGPSFFQTIMGRKFFEGDVPALVKNLGRIADALETIAARLPETKTAETTVKNPKDSRP